MQCERTLAGNKEPVVKLIPFLRQLIFLLIIFVGFSGTYHAEKRA